MHDPIMNFDTREYRISLVYAGLFQPDEHVLDGISLLLYRSNDRLGRSMAKSGEDCTRM